MKIKIIHQIIIGLCVISFLGGLLFLMVDALTVDGRKRAYETFEFSHNWCDCRVKNVLGEERVDKCIKGRPECIN